MNQIKLNKMYSKRDQLKSNHRKTCAKPGCKVKVSESKNYCLLHEAKPKQRKSKSQKLRKQSRNKYPKEFKDAKFAFQLWVRLRGADDNGNCNCVSCSKVMKWNGANCNGGHLFPAKRQSTCFNEDNCWTQCVACNKSMDNPTILNRYVDWYKLKFSEKDYERLEQLSRMTSKRTTLEMIAIRFKYTLLAENLHKSKFGAILDHRLVKRRDYQNWKKNK